MKVLTDKINSKQLKKLCK